MARGARLGFLIPPGNPTVEPEIIAMTPKGVSVHFSRMVAHGPTGTLEAQDERNRTQIAHIGESAELLAMVKESRELEKANKELLSSLQGSVEKITGEGILPPHILELVTVTRQSI